MLPALKQISAESLRFALTQGVMQQQGPCSAAGGKGSHRNFVHPGVSRPVTVSGSPGDDAKRYQVRAVDAAIKESIQ